MYGMVTSHSSTKHTVKSSRSSERRRQSTPVVVASEPLPATVTGRFFRMVRQAWSGVKLALDTDDEDERSEMKRHAPRGLDTLCRTSRFSRRELQLLYRGFKTDCPSGLVNEDALRTIYARFFPQGADATKYVHYVFKAFDRDGNGEITFEDLVIGLSVLLRGSAQEKLQWAFRLYDLNDDGQITRHELLHIVASVHGLVGRAQKEIVIEQVERVFQKLDQNQDGIITVDEFLEFCLQDEDVAKSLTIFDDIW